MQLDNDTKYVTATVIKKTFGVSGNTLRRWSDGGKIEAVKMLGGKRLYSIRDVKKVFNVDECTSKRVCYARVSSSKQCEDLKRQITDLKSNYPDHEVIKDIGSGLNWKRSSFIALLDRVLKNEIEQIVVLHNDRMCRFAFELIEWICKKHRTKIVVHNKVDNGDTHRELADDLLSVTNYFVAKNNGKRAAENRKRRGGTSATNLLLVTGVSERDRVSG